MDSESNPIESATVTIGEDSETTDATGKAEFELEYGDYSATISADGYVTATESLAFRSNHKNFSVTLVSATGTVTVTCKDSEELAVENATVFLTTETITIDSPPSSDIILGGGVTGADGTITLKTLDGQQWSDTDADIPFGTYYLSGVSVDDETIASLNETFTVDGDETVTITLTPINNG